MNSKAERHLPHLQSNAGSQWVTVAAEDCQEEVVAFLQDPANLQPGTTKVERIDTHAAMVFLAGDLAFKVKRAVAYPYLDFSSLARRD